MGEGILGVVLLITGHFDLLETPLGKVGISGTKVASHHGVPQPESSCQSAELALVARRNVLYYFDLPVVLVVADRQVTVT